MVNQPTYLANLKAYGRARWKDDAEAETSAKSMTELESDRGAILMAATNVEDMLEYKILQKLPTLQEDETARKLMFDQDGPLSTFSRKIAMAYAMGFIDKDYRKHIDLVREIRNTAAHSRLPVSVEVPAIKAAIEVLVADSIDALNRDNPRALLGAFMIRCAVLAHYIISGEKIEGFEALARFHASLQEPQGAHG